MATITIEAPHSTTSAPVKDRRCCSCTARSASATYGPSKPAGSLTGTPAFADHRRGHSRSSRGTVESSAAEHADDVVGLIKPSASHLACSSASSYRGGDRRRGRAPPPGDLRGVVLGAAALQPRPRERRRLIADIKPGIDEAIASRGSRAGVDGSSSRWPGTVGAVRRRRQGAISLERRHRVRRHRAASSDIDAQGSVPSTSGLRHHRHDQPSGPPGDRPPARSRPARRPLRRSPIAADVGYAEQPDAFFQAVSTFAAELRDNRHERVLTPRVRALAVRVDGAGRPSSSCTARSWTTRCSRTFVEVVAPCGRPLRWIVAVRQQR